MNLTNSLRYDNFINDLVTDLMPFIEKHFSVATGRENTAITGFSDKGTGICAVVKCGTAGYGCGIVSPFLSQYFQAK